MIESLHLPHGDLTLPVFVPDATRAVIRSIDSADLERCGIDALVMNTFHLMQHPGSSTVQSLGGLHKMTGWSRPILTDSGGFQVYSLIHQNPKYGNLTNKGATFRTDASERKFTLTPEKSIQLQVSYGSDLLFCLDDCTHVSDSLQAQQASVKRTIDWARRCKTEYQRLIRQKGISESERHPLLFAVVQGGGYRDLRRRCAEALLEIGFDGFGYGGWPLDEEGQLLEDMVGYTRELIPTEFPMHALGIAHPSNIVRSAAMGYELFDGAMPTRDARHGRLYAFTTAPATLSRKPSGSWFSYVYADDAKHTKAGRPISQFCDCLTCSRYSLGYLHHLFEIKDTLAFRLATIHNLRFMTQLTDQLRKSRDAQSNRFPS